MASPQIATNTGSNAALTYLLTQNASGTAPNQPKAYLNILFFDGRFTFVGESSQAVRVQTAGNGASPLALLNIKVPKNGYCLVYISNESNIPVYFDNMQVRHDRGRIIEENHYYAYGLKIAALSSKAFGGAPNNYQYQGDYSEFDDDLGWNDFALRSYDPQLGRFLQHDPYDQFASGYVGMGNDPGNGVDPTGGFFDPGPLAQLACPGSGGGSFLKVLNTISAIGSVASKGMGLGGSITSNMGNNNQSLNQSANSGYFGSSGPNEGSGEDNSADGCDCPKGYGPKPKLGGDQRPFYRNIDDVAKDWATSNWLKGKNPKGSFEYSSRIYSVSVTSKDILYVATNPIRFDSDKLAKEQSPGIFDVLHQTKGNVPGNGNLVGHIHMHWHTSESLSRGLIYQNTEFSVGDREYIKAKDPSKKFRGSASDYFHYLLGSQGVLHKRNKNDMDYYPDGLPNYSGGQYSSIAQGYFSSPPKSPPCPCYKQ